MLLSDKRAAVFGVANERSLGWQIAKAFSNEGANVVVGYQNEHLGKWVRPLCESVANVTAVCCDVNQDPEIQDVFQKIEEKWGGLDILVHSIAFADRESLTHPFIETTRQGFLTALEASAYSLLALARPAALLMDKAGSGSILTLTFLGSKRPVPNYNVMGPAKAALESSVLYLASELGPRHIRVNALSPGPITTLAARGIPGFTQMLKDAEQRSPLKKTVSGQDVAQLAVFLASDQASSITGQIIPVDAGLHLAM